MVVLQTLILISGTKATFRWQNYSFLIAMVGTLVAFIVLLFGSQTRLLLALQLAEQELRRRQRRGGDRRRTGAAHAAPDFWNVSATLPTLFSIQGFMMWNFWSVYMSGELKSASNRRRQLSVMFGALVWDTVLLIIGVLLLFQVARLQLRLRAQLPAARRTRSRPGRSTRSSRRWSFNMPILTVIIMGSFLFWSLPSMIANTFMPIRSFFAWSFDRLMPEKPRQRERAHPLPRERDPRRAT